MTAAPISANFLPYNTALVQDLIPYANNARTHSDAQVAQIAASIREFGFTNPILVDGEKGIIAGHGRLLAARKLGMAEVPLIELSHLTPAQKRAYVLADNRLALSAGWDDDLLRLELGALQAEGFDLGLVGFDPGEIDLLFALPTGGLTDPDHIPDVPDNPASRVGDTWLLGRHRLICGDSTNPAVVAAVLGGVRPHLMVTDPPYGVDYDPAWRNRAGISHTGRVGKSASGPLPLGIMASPESVRYSTLRSIREGSQEKSAKRAGADEHGTSSEDGVQKAAVEKSLS